MNDREMRFKPCYRIGINAWSIQEEGEWVDNRPRSEKEAKTEASRRNAAFGDGHWDLEAVATYREQRSG